MCDAVKKKEKKNGGKKLCTNIFMDEEFYNQTNVCVTLKILKWGEKSLWLTNHLKYNL